MNDISRRIAKQFRSIYIDGTRTYPSFQDQLTDVDWEMAIARIGGIQNIATLTHQLGLLVKEGIDLMEGKDPEEESDTVLNPPFAGANAWHHYKVSVIREGESFAQLLEQLPDHQLWQMYGSAEYGTYYENLYGIVEKTYYHLGQIVLIKKLIKLKSLGQDAG